MNAPADPPIKIRRPIVAMQVLLALALHLAPSGASAREEPPKHPEYAMGNSVGLRTPPRWTFSAIPVERSGGWAPILKNAFRAVTAAVGNNTRMSAPGTPRLSHIGVRG